MVNPTARNQAGLILMLPLFGLVAILQDGHWNWNILPWSALINTLFWIGWFGSLIVGISVLFGLLPTQNKLN